MKLFFFALTILFLLSCNSSNNNKTPPTENDLSIQKKDSFFPVTSFLKGQIMQLSSLPLTPLHTITINNKTDSSWIKSKELETFLSSFLSPKITETNLVKYFKQTSFKDLTINSITLTYDPIKTLPDSIRLTHWDVYIDPETGKIQKIYLVKQSKNKTNILTEQLTWQTNRSAIITTLISDGNNKTSLVKVDKFIWNFND